MENEPPKTVRPPNSPKFSRRWYQFSLRTLLISVALLGVVFGRLGSKIEQKRRERAAVAAIHDLHGHVFYDYQFDSSLNGLKNPHPPGLDCIRTLFGEDYYSEPVWVDFNGAEIKDDDLRHLEALTGLRALDLIGNDITDKGLPHIKGLIEMERLFLCDTQVTDAGLESLLQMSKLQVLWISTDGVTDVGIKRLMKALPECEITGRSHRRERIDNGLQLSP